MMTLKEPKRKRRVRLRARKPFPIEIGSENEWTTYTGYLGNLGVCVMEPYEMEALHSLGFFGKGSLSRSFPNFEKTRGKPLTLRHRQWARRREWLEQANELDAEASSDDFKADEWQNENDGSVVKSVLQDLIESIVSKEQRVASPTLRTKKQSKNNADKGKREENQSDKEVFEISLPESQNGDETSTPVSAKVDEVVLDSTEEEEEDEIREISNAKTAQSVTENTSGDTDVILLNDEEMPGVESNEKNNSDTEYEGMNSKDLVKKEEKKLLVLPDSDSDVENYLNNIKPTIENQGFPVRETMYLIFEEAFFLMFGLGCLQIVDSDGNLLNILDAWKYFCNARNDFVQKYVVYHYFRSKGWVVKPGLKYGGDFLLYKQGPPFYHASYIVIVEVSDADTLIRDEKKAGRQMTWKKLFGLDRLSETAAKEILFAEVLWPSEIPSNEIPSTPELLAEFTVRELLYRRWIPKQTREEIDLENDDDDDDDNDYK